MNRYDKFVKISNSIFTAIMIAFIIIGSIYFIVKGNYLLTKYPRYTIGETNGIIYMGKSGKSIKYKFKVGSNDFMGTIPYRNDIKEMNGRYFVLYSFKSPKYNELILDKIVPDTIITIPNNGWAKLPIK